MCYLPLSLWENCGLKIHRMFSTNAQHCDRVEKYALFTSKLTVQQKLRSHPPCLVCATAERASSSEGTSQSYDLVLVACWMRNADITTISEVSPRRKKHLQKVLTGTWIGTYLRLRTLSGIWANISHLSEGTSVKHKISMSILELNWAQVGTDKIVDRIGKKLDKYYNKNA